MYHGSMKKKKPMNARKPIVKGKVGKNSAKKKPKKK